MPAAMCIYPHRRRHCNASHIESNDPKAFWNIIKRTTKHPNTGNVIIDEIFEHFSVLNATVNDESGLESSLSESQTPSNVCNEYSESETLNSPITEDEVSKAVKRLKNGKACQWRIQGFFLVARNPPPPAMIFLN